MNEENYLSRTNKKAPSDATFEIKYADGSQERDYSPIGMYVLPADTQSATYKNLDARCSFLRFEIKR